MIRDSSKLMHIGLVRHASVEPGLGVGRHVYLYNMSNIPRVVFLHEEYFKIHYPRPKGSMNVNTYPSRDPLSTYLSIVGSTIFCGYSGASLNLSTPSSCVCLCMGLFIVCISCSIIKMNVFICQHCF